jgi:RNA polymerase sigma-70 factor, ECF subfamily
LDDADIREFLAGDYRRLVAGFSVIAGSRAAAEDAVQEALVRAWERERRGESIEGLAVWVAVVARNIIRSGLRRLLVERRARAGLVEPLGLTEPEAQSVDELVDVVRAVMTLPSQQREAVALHYFADLPLTEVARITGSTEGAVKSLLHRARGSLGEKLGGLFAVDAPKEAQGRG